MNIVGMSLIFVVWSDEMYEILFFDTKTSIQTHSKKKEQKINTWNRLINKKK
jgi:hypothetical protein